MAKMAIMLVNIGTPKSPETRDVARYLREFLMDPLVITLPFLLRWILVNLIIVPLRAPKSAEKYKKVWTDKGSPLSFHSESLANKLQTEFPFPVVTAMHYGNPSIQSAIKKLHSLGIERIIVVPMYPQFAEATTGSTIKKINSVAKVEKIKATIEFTPAFYQQDEFLNSWISSYEKHFPNGAKADHVLFTFHGLPLSQIKSICSDCTPRGDCCARVTQQNKDCYRMQCFETARSLAIKLELNPTEWSVSFQSRLGRAEWIRPYTEDILACLAKNGVKRLAIFCPAFTADCLETIEEIGIEGRHTFLANGGKEYLLLPCLNDEEYWMKNLRSILAKAHGI